MLVLVTLRFACRDFETSTGLIMPNMNGLCVCETRVLVRMEVHEVSLSVSTMLNYCEMSEEHKRDSYGFGGENGTLWQTLDHERIVLLQLRVSISHNLVHFDTYTN
jgi:hypothetical protein